MSGSKRVKFEIAVQGLSVKFEGDLTSFDRMHGDVAGALTSLATTPKMLRPPEKTAPPIVTVETSGTRRRSSRRRRPAGDISSEAANGDTAVPADSGAEGTVRPRRAAGGGQAALITQLKADGFFGGKRTNADIRAALAEKGHTFRSNEINPTLVHLTQHGVLKREFDSHQNQWMYLAA